MRGNKLFVKIFLICLALVLALSAVNAAEFAVGIEPDYQSIRIDQTAEYKITVHNNMDTVENFELYSPDVTWDVTTVPSSDRILTIAPGAKHTVTVRLKPLYVNPGLFGVRLNIRVSGKNMLIRNYLMVGVTELNPPPGEYLPAIRSNIVMGDIVDPRENITVKLELENQNRRQINNMDIKLRSDVINTGYKTNLGPLEKKTVTINLAIDPLTQPQEDVLRALIFTSAINKTYQYESMPFSFRVLQYGGLVENITETKEFLKTIRIITLTNIGNGDFIDVYKVERGFFARLFTSGTPKPKRYREDGVGYTGWSVNLGPYEKVTITEIVSFRVPVAVLILIVICIILYYKLRSPITLHKSATVLATKEGGISELKVLIVLKNRTGKVIKGVNVIDKVPHIADVSREFDMGTLHPTKMLKHAKKGTLIKWEMKELDKFEERVLAYKIKSRLSILGDFKLPVTVVKFASRSGRERSSHSNSVTLVSA